MSVINLEVNQVRNLSNEISTIDTSLLNNYLPQLESELDAIGNNVQGESLHNILTTINSQFSSVNTTLSTSLPKLEAFLEDQIKTYTLTEEELKEELNAVLNKIATLIGFNTQTNPNGETVQDEKMGLGDTLKYMAENTFQDKGNFTSERAREVSGTYVKNLFQTAAVGTIGSLLLHSTGLAPVATAATLIGLGGGQNYVCNTGETYLETLTKNL